jgi:hypothetical protein
MPSLTLEDLQGAQDDILDVPVVAEADEIQGEDPAGPQARAQATDGLAGDGLAGEGGSGSSFASAKDAIEKLMGKAPALPPPPSARMGGRTTMDVEATLDALETTLGGLPSHPPQAAAPEAARPKPGPEPLPDPLPEPTPDPVSAPEPEPAPRKPDLASTVKLSSEEIREAMAGLDGRNRAALAPVTPPVAVTSPVEVQPPDLLKVQLEQETCTNVSQEQMTAWIEQGRVQEYHMVARQFSEHWIEACKVPALRPVFDRMRKVRSAPADAFPAPEPAPVKRGLFSGLFGRN